MNKKNVPMIIGFQGGVATFEQVGASDWVAPGTKPDVAQTPGADQYAVAAVLNELLKGVDQEGAVLAAGVLARASAVEPVSLYRDMAEMAAALEAALAAKKSD